MPPPAPPSAVRPPLQARSRRTLDRILAATERLLEERSFEEIGVQEIVRAARTSVGSFYARFEDKSALLSALYERYDADLGARIAAWRSGRPAPEPGLSGACVWVSGYLVEHFSARRNLLRALALHVRQRPEVVGAETSRRRAEQHAFLQEALLEHRDSIRDVDPEQAARTAIFLAASACRERILFDDTPHARAARQARGRLVSDLARMLAGYLLCPELRERS